MKKALNIKHAGVVEVADAPDSKSGDPCDHAGSSPASGTRNIRQLSNITF